MAVARRSQFGSAGRPGGRKPLAKLAEDTKYRINLVVRHAAVEIANGLAQAGPVWSGEFRDSYRIEAVGKGATPGIAGAYPYNLKNTPMLSTTVKELGRVTKLQISNIAPHASIAIDGEPSFFYATGAPIKPVINGYRAVDIPTLRGDIVGSPSEGLRKTRITAPLDWLDTYLKGGELQKNLSKGVRIGLSAK